jgi:hypothetical protein
MAGDAAAVPLGALKTNNLAWNRHRDNNQNINLVADVLQPNITIDENEENWNFVWQGKVFS